jgi:hypothetical protein
MCWPLQEERRRVLRKCLGRINQEVMGAAEQGVAVRLVLCNMLFCVIDVVPHTPLHCSLCTHLTRGGECRHLVVVVVKAMLLANVTDDVTV